MKQTLYKRIFDDLLMNIENNTYPIGAKLPTEAELSIQYDVSRITAKKAMDMLAEKNLVARKQGFGTVVIKARPTATETPETQKILTIGLIQHDISPTFGLEFLQTMELLTQENDMLLITGFSNHSIESEEKLLERFRAYGVEGIIISPVHNQSFNNTFIRLVMDRYPLVLFDRYLKDITCPNVVSMNYEGAQEVINHLFALGHTNIAFLSRDIASATTLQERRNGILKAMAQNGLTSHPDWWVTDLTEKTVNQNDQYTMDKNKIKKLLTENPEITAIVCLKCFPVPMVFEAAEELEKTIPRDLSLISFDSPGFLCNKIINLSHIKQDEQMLAKKAFMMLCELMNGKETPIREKVPVHLKIGATTAPPNERTN
jgi:DNA-binding LacI/PurR family transcriptional regulator